MAVVESRRASVVLAVAAVALAVSACIGDDGADVVRVENGTKQPLRIFYGVEVLAAPGPERSQWLPPGDETSIVVDEEADWPARIHALTEDGSIAFDRVFTRDESSDLDFRIVITAD